KWSLDEFLQLPAVKVYADFHCVTRWSRLDNLWGGVSTRTIAELVGVNSEARFVLVEAQDHGWTTNLPVEYFLAEDSLFAWSNDGQPIPPEHGGPVRLIVPRLYAWKSAKWVKGVQFLDEDRAGFWEEGGYHMRGNPWAGGDGERFRWQGDEQKVSDSTLTETKTSQPAAPTSAVAVPKDAAAVILLREDSDARDPVVFWARRSERMAFMPGFYAFPGGQRDDADADVEVDNAADRETATMIACAARELLEELGVLASRGADSLTKGQLASLLDDLTSARMTFAGLLAHYGLRLDARDFQFAGRWVTPPFSPRRFDTLFFVVKCPRKQEPRVLTPEFDTGEWTSACEAYARWQRSELMAAPPVVHALRTLAAGLTEDLYERFLIVPQAHRRPLRAIE